MPRHICLHAKRVKNWDARNLQPPEILEQLYGTDVLVIHISGTSQVLVPGYTPTVPASVSKKQLKKLKNNNEQPTLF